MSKNILEQKQNITDIWNFVNNLSWVKNIALTENSFILSKSAQQKHPQDYINLYIKYRVSPIFFLYMISCQYMQEEVLFMGQEEKMIQAMTNQPGINIQRPGKQQFQSEKQY